MLKRLCTLSIISCLLISPAYADKFESLSVLANIIEEKFNTKVIFNNNIADTALSRLSFTTKAELYSLLYKNKLTAIESGTYIKILPLKEARSSSLSLNAERAFADQYITQVLTLKRLCASKILPLIRHLVAQYAHLAAYSRDKTSILIITERKQTIEKLKSLITQIESELDEGEGCGKNQAANTDEVIMHWRGKLKSSR